MQGSNPLAGIINSSGLVQLHLQHRQQSAAPAHRQGISRRTSRRPASGATCATSIPLVAYKRFIPMHYLIPSQNGHNVLGVRAQLGYMQGFGGDVAPPNNRFYSGGEQRVARLRRARRHALRLRAHARQLPAHQSRRQLRSARSHQSRRTTSASRCRCPVYGVASIGGDTNLTTNVEYRIPDRRAVHVLVLRRLRHRCRRPITDS